jgi:hypothetical protein
MASKRARKKKSPNKHKKAQEAMALSASARDEIAKLLKEDEQGTLTRVDMETGLEEIDERLKRLMIFIRHLL